MFAPKYVRQLCSVESSMVDKNIGGVDMAKVGWMHSSAYIVLMSFSIILRQVWHQTSTVRELQSQHPLLMCGRREIMRTAYYSIKRLNAKCTPLCNQHTWLIVRDKARANACRPSVFPAEKGAGVHKGAPYIM